MNARDADDPAARVVSAWAPMRHEAYRKLWLAWIGACLAMWMNDVAAAWVMTSLTNSPVMVALVQTAATLPIFLLGVPAGALADIADRRRILTLTQVWAAAVAAVLFVLVYGGAIAPVALLVLVFANGIVLALRWPAYSAIVPELVPPREIAVAMALNGIANNGSRVAGPLIVGAVIAAAGAAWVFALNAALSIVAAVLLARFAPASRPGALPNERLVGAMRVGLQHVRQSTRLRQVLLHVAVFFVNMIAVVALLPLVALRLEGGGPGTFTLLMSAMGAGAVVGAMIAPAVDRRFGVDRRFPLGTLLYAAGTLGAAAAPTTLWALPATFAAGVAFMLAANTLVVGGTIALPGWVRARGLAIYQLVMMGASAAGAAWWGWVASATSVRVALVLAGIAMAVGVLATRRIPLPLGPMDEARPADSWSAPEVAVPLEPDSGPVLVTVEYRIDPARTDEFLALMRESRRVWLAHGVLAWSLFSDVGEAGRHIEHMVDESWAAYLRRNERVAASYLRLRERKHALHLGPGAPAVTRYVGSSVAP